MLDVVPAQYRVKVIRRPRYACRACEEAVVQAPAPERPIDGGMATEALLAQVLVAKYADHLPLVPPGPDLRAAGHRARPLHALRLGRPGRWWLEPLWRLLRRHVLGSTRIFADDTPLPVLDPGRGRTKTGRFWAYAVDDRPWNGSTPPAVVYLYAGTARASTPPPTWPASRASCRPTATGGFKSLLDEPAAGADPARLLLGPLPTAVL